MDLTEIRERIDHIDRELLRLFLERMDLSEQAAAYKTAHGLPLTDPAREREILSAVAERAGDRALYASHLFSTLIHLSRSRQAELTSRLTDPPSRSTVEPPSQFTAESLSQFTADPLSQFTAEPPSRTTKEET